MTVRTDAAGVNLIASQADEAYRRIEEQIVMLTLAPGSAVTEKELSQRTGFGRTPVREAVLRLKQDHLVTVLPRQGILIRPIEPEYASMALEMRQLVERLVITRASVRATARERGRLGKLADRFETAAQAQDVVEFMKIDRNFNDFVAAVARHPVADRTLAPLHAVSRRLGYYFAADKGHGLEETGPAHARLSRAVAGGDPEGAGAALDDLLVLTRRITEAIALEVDDIDIETHAK